MSDPSDLTGASRFAEDAEFDRSAHPALGAFFAELDDLASPPPDAEVRLQHISRAAATAAAGGTAVQPTPWRTVGWRVAAVAAGLTVVVAGLGADDRLPEPAQRMVSSVADALGVDLPDGSDRSTGRDDENHGRPGITDGRNDGTRGNSSTTGSDNRRDDAPRATPAEPGEPGEPAIPAVPADPEHPERPETPDRDQPEPPATPQSQPAPPPPTPSSTMPPPQPSPSAPPPSDPSAAGDAEHSNDSSEPPAPRHGADSAPDDAGRNSEKSSSRP